jgi:hypothetical protein
VHTQQCVLTRPRTLVSPDAAVGAFSELTRAGTPGWKHLRRQQQQRRNEQNRQQHRGVYGLKEHSQARPHQCCILPHVCAQPPRELVEVSSWCAAGELRRYEYRQWYC